MQPSLLLLGMLPLTPQHWLAAPAPSAAAFAEIKQPAVELAGSNYEGQGLSLNVNESSWFYSGNALSWRSYPSIKVKPDGDANASPGG